MLKSITMSSQCPKCGSNVYSSVASGECVGCLMQLTLESLPTSQSQADTFLDPQELDDLLAEFDVIDVLGRGGMGVVYRARQNKLDREVAIKVPPRRIVQDRSLARRFIREAKALAKLHHPNVVTAFDVGEVQDLPYLVMEYVEGTDLASHVQQHGPVDAARAIGWIIQAATGLEFAHHKGIVHRDVKPGNLLVDQMGNVKILDLGLALLERESIENESDQSERDDAAATDLTQTGNVMGSVDYMSPEQAVDMHVADARSDIYSLGCTLYYLVTGQRMYAEKTRVETVAAHREQPIPSLRDGRPSIPVELDLIFRSMVAKTPQDRPASMLEVAASLRSLIDGLTTHRNDDTDPTEVAAAIDTSVDSMITIESDRVTNTRPTRTLWLFGGVVAAIFFTVVIYRVKSRGTVVIQVESTESPASDIAKGELVSLESKSEELPVTASPQTRSPHPQPPRWAADPSGGPMHVFAEHLVYPDIYSIETIEITRDSRWVRLSGTGGHAVMDFQKILSRKHQNECRVRRNAAPAHRAYYSRDGNLVIGLKSGDNEGDLSLAEFDSSLHLRRILSKASRRPVTQSIDGSLLAYFGPDEGQILVIDMSTANVQHQLDAGSSAVSELQFSPDGSRLAAILDSKLHFWDLKTGEHHVLDAPGQQRIGFSADGKTLVTVGTNGRAVRWDNDRLKKLNEFPVGSLTLACVHIMKDGRHALIGSFDGICYLVDVLSGEIRAHLIGVSTARHVHKMRVLSIAVSADERYALTGTSEYRLRLWRIPTADDWQSFVP